MSDGGEFGNEAPVEVDEAQGLLDAPLVARGLPLSDDSDLGRVGPDLPLPDDDTQVVDRGLLEDALLLLEAEPMLLQSRQDPVHQPSVLEQVVGEYEDVVQVDRDVSLVDQVPQDVVHRGLEGGGRVGEPKEHDRRLKEAPVGSEGSLPLVPLAYPDVVVAPADVELGEDPEPLQLVDQLLDQGKQVAVLHRGLVEFPVVLHRSQRGVLLFDEEEGGRHR